MADLGLKRGIQKSNELYKRALEIIPVGTQTFSRAPGVFPDGAAPKYVARAKGSHVWDVDGNEYIDMVLGCGPVTLGYNFKHTDDAIKKQLEDGFLFSMMHPLEIEVAEKLVDCIPCAEMVRFSKNGSDVCATAIRLARHITNREIILCYGYHGFQDWYIGTTDRSFGIPECVKALTKPFNYNDMPGLKKLFETYPGKIAAVIMEPVIAEKPKGDYLSEVKQLVHDNGALLIFDEMISGFRFSMGGAQEYFNVIPDLATFGKGITNGMPLGVLVGKREYMKHLDKVFLSSTYAPEALTLAAASTVIDFYKANNVIEKLWEKGTYIINNFKTIIEKYHLNANVSIAGYPVRMMVNTHDTNGMQNYKLASLYQQEMFKHGVLCWSGLMNFSYSHTQEDLAHVVGAFDKTCQVLQKAVGKNDYDSFLTCKVGAPVFKGLRERNAVSN